MIESAPEQPVLLETRQGRVYFLASKVIGIAPSPTPGISMIFIAGGGLAVAASVTEIAQALKWELPKPVTPRLVGA